MAISTVGVQTTAASRITEAVLEAACWEGDPPADDWIDSLGANGTLSAAALDADVRRGCPIGGPVRDAWQAIATVVGTATPSTEEERKLLNRGQEVFAKWGPQIVVSLCFGALAGGYAAHRVSNLLVGTSNLNQNDKALRRALETVQFLFDVMGEGEMVCPPGRAATDAHYHAMAEGGVEPWQRGIESAQRVRLMHAGIRRLVRERSPGGRFTGEGGAVHWDPSWGKPLNQELMLGTILVMSVHVLECLKKQWVPLDRDEQWAYVYTWLRVGREMGVKDELIPGCLEEAKAAWRTVRKRQYARSEANEQLEATLLDAVGPLFPRYFRRAGPRGYVCKLNDAEVAEMVGLQRGSIDRFWFWWWWNAQRLLTYLEVRSTFLRRHMASAGTTFVRNLYTSGLDHQRAPFAVPTKLPGDWAFEGQGFKPWVRQLPGYVSEHIPRPRRPTRGSGL